MTKWLRSLCLVVSVFSAVSAHSTCSDLYVYMSSIWPDSGGRCDGDTQIYVAKDYYLYATRGSLSVPISEIRFTVDDFPQSGSEGIIDVSWFREPDAGDLYSELVWYFDPPLNPPDFVFFPLGTITLFPITENWPGENRVVWFDPGVATDIYGQNRFHGSKFTFNCYSECPCEDSSSGTAHCIEVTNVDPAPGTVVQGDFTMLVDVKAMVGQDWPSEPGPYVGQLYVDGLLVEEFDGFGDETETFDISAVGIPNGGTVLVEIDVNNGDSAHCLLEYTVDTVTGISYPEATVDWSFVKGLY